MVEELFVWPVPHKKKSDKDNRKTVREARRLFMRKHGSPPNTLTVRLDEYEDWMDMLGMCVEQVSNNLAPRHFRMRVDDDIDLQRKSPFAN